MGSEAGGTKWAPLVTSLLTTMYMKDLCANTHTCLQPET
jgi:hypothetical protein